VALPGHFVFLFYNFQKGVSSTKQIDYFLPSTISCRCMSAVVGFILADP
jgi:hypothetical protein